MIPTRCPLLPAVSDDDRSSRPDLRAVYRSPHAALTGAAAAAAVRKAMATAPICIIPRELDAAVAAAVDACAGPELPGFDLSGEVDRVRAGIGAALAASPHPVMRWLADDMRVLLELYATATRARVVRARLQAVADDKCRAFHVDEVTSRLVTTYRGPGTEWTGADRALPHPPGPAAVERLARGTVAVLRGAKAATPERPGLLHRSPAVAGTGVTRLFLAINDVAR